MNMERELTIADCYKYMSYGFRITIEHGKVTAIRNEEQHGNDNKNHSERQRTVVREPD